MNGKTELEENTLTYPELERAAAQLRKSERGRRALKNLSALYRDGGSGLDDINKAAALKLFSAMLYCPWEWPANLTQ